MPREQGQKGDNTTPRRMRPPNPMRPTSFEEGRRKRYCTHMLKVLERRHVDSRLFKVDATAVDHLVDDGRVNRALRFRERSGSCQRRTGNNQRIWSQATRVLTTKLFDIVTSVATAMKYRWLVVLLGGGWSVRLERSTGCSRGSDGLGKLPSTVPTS